MRLDFREAFVMEPETEEERMLEEVMQIYGCAYLNSTGRGRLPERLPDSSLTAAAVCLWLASSTTLRPTRQSSAMSW
jgi:hypothetical protein